MLDALLADISDADRVKRLAELDGMEFAKVRDLAIAKLRVREEELRPRGGAGTWQDVITAEASPSELLRAQHQRWGGSDDGPADGSG